MEMDARIDGMEAKNLTTEGSSDIFFLFIYLIEFIGVNPI